MPTKKTAAKKTAAKKTAKKVAKTAAKKTAAKKAAKKPAAKKAAKKTTAKKAAKKSTAKKVAKKATKKTAAKKPAAKKTATKKAPAKTPAKKLADVEALSAYGAVTAEVTKAASKKAAAKKADDLGHGAIALPGAKPKKPLDVGAYGGAPAKKVPSSKRAAVTVVPADSDVDGDVDDALDDAMGDAFDAVFAAPKPKKPSAPFVPGEPSLDLAHTCAALALEKKADNVVILQVSELTSYADYFVIAAASSERQAQAVARNIADALKVKGKQPLSTDGMEQGNWVIVDYGAVVVHVFMESARAYYDLDGFWVDAPRVDVDEPRGKAALDYLDA
ncbi:MAG TPA: ribosome silencing factor [Myxococcota bacterium]